MERNIIIMFKSRNKDNKGVPDFHERTEVYLSDKPAYEHLMAFKEFTDHGVDGEMSRMYVSVNARDLVKIKKALIIKLIADDNVSLLNLNNTLVSIAMAKENSAQSHWMFDYDDDPNRIEEFVNDIMDITGEQPIVSETPHGYAVIVYHGFDTRDLMAKWGENVSLKRDDFLCYDWRVKNIE